MELINKKYSNPKLAIVVTTYYRPDGKTFSYIKNTLQSVFNQTYKNWKIYLIGDNYKDKAEFEQIIKLCPPNKTLPINLPVAVERKRYPKGGEDLWHSGGAHGTNIGIEYAINEGYDYICKLDHDDIYFPDHLETLATAIETTQSPFLYTKSKYLNGVLPRQNPPELYTNLPPTPINIINSSTCINYRIIPLRRRDPLYFYGRREPGDINFYNRVNPWMKQHDLKPVFINKLTVDHFEEGYTRNTSF